MSEGEVLAPASGDRALAARVAVLMRAGTLVAAVLLVAGVAFWGLARGVATVLLTSGCLLLLLLPVARLVMMLRHFAEAGSARFVLVTALVLLLVLVGAAVGVWL